MGMREMKDSGIEWIGQIPKDWSLKKGRYLFVQRNDRGNDENLQLLSPSQKFGVIPQSLLEDLTTQTAVKLKENTDLSTLKTVHKGDFCISLRSFQGGFEYSEYEGVVSPAYQIFYKKEDLVNTYYKYIFKDSSFISKMNSYTMSLRDGKNISYFDFGNTYLPLPTVCEQQQIADFLDTKCSEIDATAEDIQKEIDLLEEYKKSVITEVVTKGLNPDAEMKDSGIEWIGEIPKDWDIHPVYAYFEEGKTKNYRMQEQNLLSLSYGRIIRKDINTNGGLLPASFNTYNVVEAGDIIIRPTDLQNDKRSLRTGLVKEQGIITSAYIDLRPKKDVNSEYYHYLLHSYDIIKVFYNMGNGVRQGLNYSEFAKLLLLEPSQAEQQQIVDYLNAQCTEIDTLIADKKRQLDILAEYKKSLIYEYVTGKKEVPVNE
jgi:type I restriction enzyme S subunit